MVRNYDKIDKLKFTLITLNKHQIFGKLSIYILDKLSNILLM